MNCHVLRSASTAAAEVAPLEWKRLPRAFAPLRNYPCMALTSPTLGICESKQTLSMHREREIGHQCFTLAAEQYL